jgi:long-chain acyl-CoA synthetase
MSRRAFFVPADEGHSEAMARESLLEYFREESRPRGEAALVWRRGYRTVRWTWADLRGAAVRFAAALQQRGIAKGDRVLIWGENSGEWVAAFLGCMFAGAVAVPMDVTAEAGFARRVARHAGVRLAVMGRGLELEDGGVASLGLEDFFEGSPVGSTAAAPFTPVAAARGDAVEIVFTSGTTAEPRGVVLTHGNLLANLGPIESEIAKYRRYERLFHPLKFLDLLPLSHVFGQLLGIFIPQVIGATTVFLDTLNPAEVTRTIRNERVSLLVTVPRLIESLRDHVERDLDARGRRGKCERDVRASAGEHFLKRWWRFRYVRRKFGWRFWAIVSGGAALPAAAEQFWDRLGYAVIQGYGLTETTSLVSLNHPFRLGKGSIGKTLPGLEVKLADDGEILVRGENVASGYWKDAGVTSVLDADGWFHTGDLGERDASGNLYFKGRQKNVIVTPEGLNVFPQDLEAELRKEAGVRDCVVVGLARDGNAEPCAVLLMREGADEDAAAVDAVRAANGRLAAFQQMRRWMLWPDQDFPRTPTQKPMLGRIRQAAEARFGAGAASVVNNDTNAATNAPGALAEIFARVSHGRELPDGAGGLQLSSVERVELMSALEDRYQVDLSETEFAAADSVRELARLVEQPAVQGGAYPYARWAQSWPARAFRFAVQNCVARPAMLILAWPRVRGRENLRGVPGPALVVASHQTYLDPSYVLQALPGRLRRRLAVAMDGERLALMRKPPASRGVFLGLIDRVKYFLIVSIYNVFPLPRAAGFRKSFAFAGDLIDRGWSVLVFPEGELTRDGKIAPFRAGIGLLADNLKVPVVPVRLEGLYERRILDKSWAPWKSVRVSIGAPVRFDEKASAEEIARELEKRVAALGDLRPDVPQ